MWGWNSGCSGQPSAIVVLNYDNWIQLFPQFKYLSSPQVQMYFNIATNYIRNDGFGPVCDLNQKTDLLYLTTAHIAQLMAPTKTGGAPSGLVGRINHASEGSVSVGTDFPVSASAAWWAQTQYGAMVWQMMLPFRLGPRYVPGFPRNQQPWPYQ